MNAIVSVNNLKDYQVLNPLGESLGHISDVMFDSDLKRAQYFVLSFGGFLGMGDKLFAVPVEVVHLDTENECLVLDVEQEQLKDAPGFDKHDRPISPDRAFERSVFRFEPRGSSNGGDRRS